MILSRYPAPKAAEEVVKAALKAGASDNVTAVVLDMPEAQKGAAAGIAFPLWAWAAMGAVLLILLLAVAGFFAFKSKDNNPSGETAKQPTLSTTALAANAQSTPLVSKKSGNATPTPLPTGGGVVTTIEAPDAGAPAGENDDIKDAIPTAIKEPTATPTFTPAPTKPRRTSHPTKPSSPSPNFSITLKTPEKGFTGDKVTLKWESAPLPKGVAFEPVIWKTPDSEDLKAHGMSPTGVIGIQTSVGTSMSILDSVKPLKMQSGNDYYWGVCIVRNKVRIWCSPGRLFRYQRSDGSGESAPTSPPPTSPPSTPTPDIG